MPRPPYDIVTPPADSMSASLRASGYDLQTAVADIIDNAVSAGANEIDVHFEWDGPDSWVRITDNGAGMDDAELVVAMTPGSRHPREARRPTDLGRFGLGLKTASFSQARAVTVRSHKPAAAAATRSWDLDLIEETREWALVRGAPDKQAEAALESAPRHASGTSVLWQKMDRIVGPEPAADANAHKFFQARMRDVREHLGMVFHRFISQPRPLRIRINGGAEIPAWDPFLSAHPTTEMLPDEVFGAGDKTVQVQPYILPHQAKVSRDEHELAAGPKGWNAQQGYYIYRNRRLIVAGEWLGFFRQEEHCKLARIRVDITNALDEEWKIDIKKAQARPPDDIRRALRRIGEATRKRAQEVYRARGKVIQREASDAHTFVWQAVQKNGKQRYRVNRDHPLVKRLLSGGPVDKSDMQAFISLVEQTIPVPHIIGTFAENVESVEAPYADSAAELERVARAVAKSLAATGHNPAEIRRTLLAMEPFHHYPHIIAALPLEDGET